MQTLKLAWCLLVCISVALRTDDVDDDDLRPTVGPSLHVATHLPRDKNASVTQETAHTANAWNWSPRHLLARTERGSVVVSVATSIVGVCLMFCLFAAQARGTLALDLGAWLQFLRSGGSPPPRLSEDARSDMPCVQSPNLPLDGADGDDYLVDAPLDAVLVDVMLDRTLALLRWFTIKRNFWKFCSEYYMSYYYCIQGPGLLFTTFSAVLVSINATGETARYIHVSVTFLGSLLIAYESLFNLHSLAAQYDAAAKRAESLITRLEQFHEYDIYRKMGQSTELQQNQRIESKYEKEAHLALQSALDIRDKMPTIPNWLGHKFAAYDDALELTKDVDTRMQRFQESRRIHFKRVRTAKAHASPEELGIGVNADADAAESSAACKSTGRRASQLSEVSEI